MKQPNEYPTIRRSRADDAGRIEPLFADAFRRQPGPYSAAEVEAVLSAGLGKASRLFGNGQGVVAEATGRLIGTAAWTLEREPFAFDPRPAPRSDGLSCDATLRAVCVAPEYSGRGLGAALVRAALAEARAAGAACAHLYATAGAIEFYRRLGFAIVDRFKIRAGDVEGIDVAEMRLAGIERAAA